METNSPIHLLQSVFSGQHAKTIDFLRAENQILRKRISGRLIFTDAERRTLVKYGLRIGYYLEQVATLVKPETILAWNRVLGIDVPELAALVLQAVFCITL